mgnify:CR=1 FL=1
MIKENKDYANEKMKVLVISNYNNSNKLKLFNSFLY